MYLSAIAHYLPEQVVSNDFFLQLNGLTDEWIQTRTGIRERRKAGEAENTSTMVLQAVDNLLPKLDFPVSEIDLIVGASYTPDDTIATPAHQAQKHIQVPHIPVVYLSTACSSLLNAVEVVEGYFAMGKASRALVVVADHNTFFADITNPKSGHLWGDGAVAFILSKDPLGEKRCKIEVLKTGGAACIGKGPEAVYLSVADHKIRMPHGRDVFIHASQYMGRISQELLDQQGWGVEELDYFIPHQANLRISRKVAADLQLPMEKVLSNIQYLGNTGSAGCGIVLSENWDRLQREQRLAMAVFGGGYSYGAMLMTVE
jgi:3-oxoacyl-[acyl-carrier-protein] synthase-3